MNRSERFGRSEVPFFNSPQVTWALDQLAACKRIVIYCGAGVTIDHTGLDWGRLNSKLFNDVPAGFPTEEEARRLMRHISPLELSSILEATYTGMTAGNVEDGRNMRETRMQEVLYANTKWHWESGRLATNVIRLAAALVKVNVPVTIVTTNQDAYLERRYENWVDEDSSYFNFIKPKMHVRIVTTHNDLPGAAARDISEYLINKREDEEAGAVGEEAGNEPLLELIYLHGRVPKAGRLSEGFIPNGEKDFDARHEIAAKVVAHYFQGDETGVLVLGSGLSDQPLISGLARSTGSDQAASLQRRFAVVPLPAKVFDGASASARERLAYGLSLRGQHLGLTLLQPDFHSQISQFCEEILGRIHTPESHENGPYQERANTWHAAWSEIHDKRGAPDTYTTISKSLEVLKATIREGSNYVWKTEPMRLEFWAHDPRRRLLRLAGSTFGELRDPELAREADLSRATANSSVKAFLEGRPLFNSFADLAEAAYGSSSDRSSMWRYFLSVPIDIVHGGFNVRAGVITLTLSDEKSIIKTAVETWPKVMASVVVEMRAVGEELLEAQPVIPGDDQETIDEKVISPAPA